ncbi:MAG: hypothetical protein GY947_05480 [Rhodobacteraceae bacterium]|nr:hypothetical protein [Paracoccaceae bacterium]
MTLVTGVVDALRVLKAQNIVVGTPYLDEVNGLMALQIGDPKDLAFLDNARPRLSRRYGFVEMYSCVFITCFSSN